MKRFAFAGLTALALFAAALRIAVEAVAPALKHYDRGRARSDSSGNL